MTTPLEVVQNNNFAAMAMVRNCHRETAVLMRRTLVKLNELYEIQESKSEMMMDIDNGDFPAKMPVSQPLQSVVVSTRPNVSEDSFPSFFRRALLLSPEEESVPLIAAVVLYNLALSEHLLGSSLNNSKKISSAHRFYSLAYQIIEESKSKCAFEDLLVLAVINNLGDTSSQLYQSKRARKWFHCLGHILGMTCSGKMMPAIQEDDYMFFYLNVMLHQNDIHMASPCA